LEEVQLVILLLRFLLLFLSLLFNNFFGLLFGVHVKNVYVLDFFLLGLLLGVDFIPKVVLFVVTEFLHVGLAKGSIGGAADSTVGVADSLIGVVAEGGAAGVGGGVTAEAPSVSSVRTVSVARPEAKASSKATSGVACVVHGRADAVHVA